MSESPSNHPIHFTGSIPEHYDKFLGPKYFEPYALDIPNRFDPEKMQAVLEIGCGTGRVTNHLRKVLPESCPLIASDISPDMMGVAQEKLKGQNINWQIIDAQQLPFDDNSFDLVVSCFAFMFVEDKAKAFSEVFRVLKPGGMFLLSLWDKLELNGASDVFRKIVKNYLGNDIPKSYGLPFAFYDHAEINQYFIGAGFSDITIEQVQKTATFDSAKEAAIGLTYGASLYNEIVSRNPAWVDEICNTVEKELTEKYGDSPMAAPMSAVVCQAFNRMTL